MGTSSPFDLFSRGPSRKPQSQPSSARHPAAAQPPVRSVPSKVAESKPDAPAKKIPEKKPPIDVFPPEMREMIDKIKEMHDQLNRKLEATYAQLGWDPKAIKSFLDNPNNFTPQQWNLLQKERKALLGDMWSKLGKGDQKDFEEKEQRKETEKAAKDRKGKMLGARRNWISMR